MLRRLCIVSAALLVGGCGGKAPARTFPELQTRIRPGHTVFVVDSTGQETRGKLLEVSTSEIKLRRGDEVRRFAAKDVQHVQRFGDSLWNGAVIGAAASLPGALFADPRNVACEGDPARTCTDSEAGSRALVVGVGALAGLGIDALIRHRHPVYVAPGATGSTVRVAPFLNRRVTGLAIVVTY